MADLAAGLIGLRSPGRVALVVACAQGSRACQRSGLGRSGVCGSGCLQRFLVGRGPLPVISIIWINRERKTGIRNNSLGF